MSKIFFSKFILLTDFGEVVYSCVKENEEN